MSDDHIPEAPREEGQSLIGSASSSCSLPSHLERKLALAEQDVRQARQLDDQLLSETRIKMALKLLREVYDELTFNPSAEERMLEYMHGIHSANAKADRAP